MTALDTTRESPTQPNTTRHPPSHQAPWHSDTRRTLNDTAPTNSHGTAPPGTPGGTRPHHSPGHNHTTHHPNDVRPTNPGLRRTQNATPSTNPPHTTHTTRRSPFPTAQRHQTEPTGHAPHQSPWHNHTTHHPNDVLPTNLYGAPILRALRIGHRATARDRPRAPAINGTNTVPRPDPHSKTRTLRCAFGKNADGTRRSWHISHVEPFTDNCDRRPGDWARGIRTAVR